MHIFAVPVVLVELGKNKTKSVFWYCNMHQFPYILLNFVSSASFIAMKHCDSFECMYIHDV